MNAIRNRRLTIAAGLMVGVLLSGAASVSQAQTQPPSIKAELTAAGNNMIQLGEELIPSGQRLRAGAQLFAQGQPLEAGLVATRNTLNQIADSYLTPIRNALDYIETNLRNVKVPSITFTTTTVMNVTVVTGVNVTLTSPFTQIADRFKTMENQVGSTITSLKSLATSLGAAVNSLPQIQNEMTQSGNRLEQAGNKAKQSGQALVAAANKLP